MNPQVYLSRFYVEFGPFSGAEVVSFQQRGLLGDTDYVREAQGEQWLPAAEWVEQVPQPAKPARRPRRAAAEWQPPIRKAAARKKAAPKKSKAADY